MAGADMHIIEVIRLLRILEFSACDQEAGCWEFSSSGATKSFQTYPFHPQSVEKLRFPHRQLTSIDENFYWGIYYRTFTYFGQVYFLLSDLLMKLSPILDRWKFLLRDLLRKFSPISDRWNFLLGKTLKEIFIYFG